MEVSQSSGFLAVKHTINDVEAARADIFFEDIHAVYNEDLNLPMLYVASSTTSTYTASNTSSSPSFFQGLARSDAALVRACKDVSSYMCKDGDLTLAAKVGDGKAFGDGIPPYVAMAEPKSGRAMPTALVGMPLSVTVSASLPLPSAAASTAPTQTGLRRHVRDATKDRELHYNAGKKKAGASDPRKEPWFGRLVSQMAAMAAEDAKGKAEQHKGGKVDWKLADRRYQWSDVHNMYTNEAGLVITAGIALSASTRAVDFGVFESKRMSPPLPTGSGTTVALVDVHLASVSEYLRKIVFSPNGDVGEAEASGVVYVAERTTGIVLASSEKSIGGGARGAGPSQGRPAGEASDFIIKYTYEQLEKRRGKLADMGAAWRIKPVTTAKYPDDVSKRYKVNVDRVGMHASCLDAKGDNVDWVVVVALDLGIYFEDYTKRSEMALIVALGSIVLSITLSVMGLSSMLQAYEDRQNRENGGESDLAKQAKEIGELDPDTEEFFVTSKALLSPSIIRTNLLLRARPGKDELPPPLVDLELFDAVYTGFKAGDGRHGAIDVDGDGVITKAELTKYVLTLPNCSARSQEIDTLFNCLDQDGNGTIDLQEFDTPPQPRTDADGVSTLDEQSRALEYIMHCENGFNVTELLNFEMSLQVSRGELKRRGGETLSDKLIWVCVVQ